VRIDIVSYVEAMKLVEQGVASVEDIDKGFRLGYGRPMGPFETGDLVGLDVSYGALTAIYEEGKGIGFAIPINLAKETIPELIKEGRVIRPWVGVNGKYVEKDALA
jgi:3-hydroxybutyryl-CoA dehydrogenase